MKPQHAQQVLALKKHLDRHDTLLKQSKAVYKTWAGDIEELDFQTDLVKQALSARRTWTAELAMGCGKSVIAARIAAEKMTDGPVIYVSPSAASLGDIESGVTNKFMRVMRSTGREAFLGNVNDLSRANDVSFVTPRSLVASMQREPARIQRMLQAASCMIIDEAHHFPEDTDGDLEVFGKLHEMANSFLTNGLTVALTGTWTRLDGKHPMGIAKPDARLTVQDVVNMGRCPEIYGVQVITEVRAKHVTSQGSLYDFHLSNDERLKYLQSVVDCMKTTWRRYPVPFAAFTRTVADAFAVASRFNSDTKRTEDNGLVVLTAQTPLAQRLLFVKQIEAKQRCGFVTCAVGEEAIDIPALEVVHLVRRTRSIARNQQAVGRGLRLFEGKRRCLVVDYQTMLEGLVDRFIGLSLDDMLEPSGSTIQRCINGGAVVAQQGNATFEGISMADERALCIVNVSPKEQKIRQLIELAKKGAPRPSNRESLGRALTNYTAPSSPNRDPVLAATLTTLCPAWFPAKLTAQAKRERLLEMARTGCPRPTQGVWSKALVRYTSKTSRSYCPTFDKKIRNLAPTWFRDSTPEDYRRRILREAKHMRKLDKLERDRLMRHCALDPKFDAAIRVERPDWFEVRKSRAHENKAALLAHAQTGGARPTGVLLEALYRHCLRSGSGSYDSKLRKQLQKLVPHWFDAPAVSTKKQLLEMAKSGKPRPTLADDGRLYWKWWTYVRKGHKIYDEKFATELFTLRPDWKPKRYDESPSLKTRRQTGWTCQCHCASYTEHHARV